VSEILATKINPFVPHVRKHRGIVLVTTFGFHRDEKCEFCKPYVFYKLSINVLNRKLPLRPCKMTHTKTTIMDKLLDYMLLITHQLIDVCWNIAY